MIRRNHYIPLLFCITAFIIFSSMSHFENYRNLSKDGKNYKNASKDVWSNRKIDKRIPNQSIFSSIDTVSVSKFIDGVEVTGSLSISFSSVGKAVNISDNIKMEFKEKLDEKYLTLRPDNPENVVPEVKKP